MPANHAASLAFAPDGRLFYAEQFTGNIRVVNPDGQLEEEPFAHADVLEAGAPEWGVTGLAVDPDFAANGYLYVYFSAPNDPGPPPTVKPMLVRVKEGSDPEVLIADLPPTSSYYNVSGNIGFGADGFLYVSLGDQDMPQLAQDLSVPQGKLLRIDKETGGAASDNPLIGQAGADPRIFAYGFWEDFDFAFHPQSGMIYGSDQTVSCSELNLIVKGANYGPSGQFPWSDCSAAQQVGAIHLFAKEGTHPGEFLSFVTVRGMSFISGQVYPLIGDVLLVCEGVTRVLRPLAITGVDSQQVVAGDPVVNDCQLDVAVNPEGIVYYSNDTEIRRLVAEPVEQPD